MWLGEHVFTAGATLLANKAMIAFHEMPGVGRLSGFFAKALRRPRDCFYIPLLHSEVAEVNMDPRTHFQGPRRICGLWVLCTLVTTYRRSIGALDPGCTNKPLVFRDGQAMFGAEGQVKEASPPGNFLFTSSSKPQ